MSGHPFSAVVVLGLLMVGAASAQDAQRWPRGMSDDAGYFPLAVWLQQPRNADKYKEIGINLYVGLWDGPTELQLADLAKAGMPVICDQNAVALKNLDSKTIVGWMHGDEPDNAQAKPKGQSGWDPPIKPAKIIEDYQKIRKADPSRPVILNLGMGVAWDGWFGRGVRTNHPEDYREYVKGADVVSFDIYPAAADEGKRYDPIRGKLELVPFGVKRLIDWTDGKKPVWSCIETTRINNPKTKATPEQVRSEVWMAIIQGARGLIYFCHEFKPTVETGLLNDKEMAAAVKEINRQVTELAPVINSPPVKEISFQRDYPGAEVTTMTRRYKGSTYVFASAMHNKSHGGQFFLEGSKATTVEVIGENRTVKCRGGFWEDDFEPYDVHIYRITD